MLLYPFPMEQRISIVTLGVADLARSRAFYKRLGWRESSAGNEAIAFFQSGGMILALYPRAELAKDALVSEENPAAGPDTASPAFAGFTLSYNARTRTEVDQVLTEAKAAGAKILKPAQEAFWGGYSGYFADPDHFAWEVAWNPSFPIAEDGAIHLPE
ncbi:MAG TPA: VOC family protein [Acidobacteriaceae bacterium]|nr:VOC family protein [Acidobacteriaceae bacterium]